MTMAELEKQAFLRGIGMGFHSVGKLFGDLGKATAKGAPKGSIGKAFGSFANRSPYMAYGVPGAAATYGTYKFLSSGNNNQRR